MRRIAMYKTLKRFYFLQFLLYPAATFLTGMVSWLAWGTFFPAFIVGGISVAAFFVVRIRLTLWKCTHCGQFFKGEIFGRPRSVGNRCAHCGTKIDGY